MRWYEILKFIKSNGMMQFLTILSGCFGVMFCFVKVYRMQFTYDNVFTLFNQIFKWNFIRYALGMLIAFLTLLVVVKPNDPLPWNWILLLIFSISLIFICHILVGLWMLIASGIGFIRYL